MVPHRGLTWRRLRTPRPLLQLPHAAGVTMEKATVSLTPRPPYDFDLTCGHLTFFRGTSGVDSLVDGVYVRVLDLDSTPVLALVRSTGTVDRPRLEVELRGRGLGRPLVDDARRRISWILDVDGDLEAFYQMAGSDPHLGPLVGAFHGLHVPHTSSVYEGLVYAILGQQISTHVAHMLRTGLIQKYGPEVEWEDQPYYAFPRPEDVVEAGTDGLRALKFSARKSEYILGIAAGVATGDMDLEALRDLPPDQAVDALIGIRGVGLWTAHWLLVRALGYGDGFPHGDLALQRHLGLLVNGGVPLSPRQALEYSRRWMPYRSYATTYLFAAARSGALARIAAAVR